MCRINGLRPVWALWAALCVGGMVLPASAGDTLTPRQAGAVGVQAYLAGDYDAAERFLVAALQGRELPRNADRPRLVPEQPLTSRAGEDGRHRFWADTLAHVYWETGRHDALFDVAAEYLDAASEHLWGCRVSEREGLLGYAYQCYGEADEPRRRNRVTRSGAISDTLGRP